LLPEVVGLDRTAINKLAVPRLLFACRHEGNVNSEVATAWFDTVKAPEKQLVWFGHSAHMPMSEEPGKFFRSLVRFARPIAKNAGDGTQSLFPLLRPLLLMLFGFLALIWHHFGRGWRRRCAARQPSSFFAFVEPLFLFAHTVLSSRANWHPTAIRC
jgi:hypothetical protein